ncbi:MAG TPA: heat-inducible transcriptional repressor HrcA [Anaerolineales bacterium]|jgi:heat-inducible transcriptional repressor|nr:heat-inducible transcriptional repressor HrcA [Anaerolineales bacterium]
METLSARQEHLLGLIVREYVELPRKSGVSSKRLVEKYGLDWSSATVRNEMAALTRDGLLNQPYTSAGRIPTEAGYRYFVHRLVEDDSLPPAERRLISHQFHQARTSVDEWGRLAVAVLAHHTRAAALVTALHSPKACCKHLELISTRGRQILMVLVLQGGEVLQQLCSLQQPVSQLELSEIAARLTSRCKGHAADAVERQSESARAGIERTLLAQIVASMRRADSFAAGEVYLDGVQNVLAQKEFTDSAPARKALQLLEKRTFLEDFLASALSPHIGGVQVVIAGEGDWSELRECSMVLARYGTPNVATGAVGVFGPTRMAYDRAIGAVRHVANLMTSLVHESYG